MIFFSSERKLRNIWWVVIFFFIMADFLFPLIILADRYEFSIELWHQVIIIAIASVICQLLRRKPLHEILGEINRKWFVQFGVGLIFGFLLMLVPAIFLTVIDLVNWEFKSFSANLASTTLAIFVAALAEELLFRGFIFQRLIGGFGRIAAQIVIGLLFVLTHLNNPGMTGLTKQLASINIFMASVLFGLAYLSTKRIAMPLGIHFMANWTQGAFLGFGVSGEMSSGVFRPVFNSSSDWLTGGQFGLEASVPGLISVIMLCFLLYRSIKSSRKSLELEALRH
jgi:membrane protease YdiL (CAAX protease family)